MYLMYFYQSCFDLWVEGQTRLQCVSQLPTENVILIILSSKAGISHGHIYVISNFVATPISFLTIATLIFSFTKPI